MLAPCPSLPNRSTILLANGSNEVSPLASERATPICGNQPARTINSETTQHLTVLLDENRRLTPSTHWQDVRHLALTNTGPAEYGPGDVLTIYPKNPSEEVDHLLQQMGWIEVADKQVHYTPTKHADGGNPYTTPPIPLPGTLTTLRTLLTEHLDLNAIPRRPFFSLITHFTEDQFHRNRLLEFTKPEYVDELYDYTTRPRRSILEVLQEFDSVKIPWQWAANVFPELRGRQFSIASGGQHKTTREGNARFELLVAIVKYKTVIKKIREGVCTRYLAAMPVGTKINVGLQKGGLGITEGVVQHPVIMIGPGTGVAPMRALAFERAQWIEKFGLKARAESPLSDYERSTPEVHKALLFFGCRNENTDYFYRDEWSSLEARIPFEIFTAFSRDQSQKVYVQDVIRQHGRAVYHLLWVLCGTVYVCGSSGKMPQAVRTALVNVCQKWGDMEEEVAEGALQRLEKEGRYKQETW